MMQDRIEFEQAADEPLRRAEPEEDAEAAREQELLLAAQSEFREAAILPGEQFA